MCNLFLIQKDKMWKEIVSKLQNQIAILESENEEVNKKDRIEINQGKVIKQFNNEIEE